MPSKNLDDIVNYIIDEMRSFFSTRVSNFVISDMVYDINHQSFVIEFCAYDYFAMVLYYDLGRLGCSICFGTQKIGLKNSQKWWDEIDFKVFLNELKAELEIRIPDKFLKSRGWN